MKNEIPMDVLRTMFALNAELGTLTWLSGDTKGKPAGSKYSDGYMYVKHKNVRYLAHRIVWALHFGEWPAGCLDHANCVKSDNRISNLRIATTAENNRNKIRQANNTSGFKGVSFNKGTRRFNATISADKVTRSLGSFATAEEAHLAYKKASGELHGQFAKT